MVNFRLVQESDAEFILSLRNNPKLNRFLNPTSPSIQDQVHWIKDYKKREERKEEFYYLISENNQRKGLYRLYDINKVSFTIGSWLFTQCENHLLPFFSDLLVSDFGFNELVKNVLLFDIRKDNKKVIRYHEIKAPLLYSENNIDRFYLITKSQWSTSKRNILGALGISLESFEDFQSNVDFENVL